MRTKLLRSGLGFFAFAAGISLVNVLVFPYARENYGYGLIGLWLAYAAALALLMLAGRAVGLWSDEQLRGLGESEREFAPNMDEATRRHLLRQWHRAVEKSSGWEEA